MPVPFGMHALIFHAFASSVRSAEINPSNDQRDGIDRHDVLEPRLVGHRHDASAEHDLRDERDGRERHRGLGRRDHGRQQEPDGGRGDAVTIMKPSIVANTAPL